MILDEDHIHFDKKNQDLYTAHEIVQLLPIFNKEKMYEKFIRANEWIMNYLPNYKIDTDIISHNNNIVGKIIVFIFRILQVETIARYLQLSYMQDYKTSEITKDGFLKFHPYDYKSYVLKKYKQESLRRDFKNVL
jgi:hypothetical protein